MNLRKWQQKEIQYFDTPKRFVAASPRLGKSHVGCLFIEHHMPARALVVAPSTPCPQWAAFLGSSAAAKGFEVVELYNLTPAKLIARLDTLRGQETPFVVVLNYDKLKKYLPNLLKLKINVVVGDESHYVKTPSSGRGRAFRALAQAAEHVRLLSGTPMPNGPEDAWGQYSCLSRTDFGRSFAEYARRHLIIDPFNYNRVVGLRNPHEFQSLIDRHTGRYDRADEFGADQWQTTVRTFALSPSAQKMYKKIVDEWLLVEDKFALDVPHTMARITRLRQLTSGYLPDEHGTPVDVDDSKLRMIQSDLEDIVAANEKAVVFYQYTYEGQRLKSMALDLTARVFVINGSTPVAERAASIDAFNALPGRGIFIVQTVAGGIGISLATAQHALFASQGFSADIEEQARDRIFSPGQVRCVTYYRASQTIDMYIAAVLADKRQFQDALANSTLHEIAFGEAQNAPRGSKGF